MSSSASDDTIQQVYIRITEKIQGCQKQLNQIDAQISGNQREMRLAALTKRELESLDDNVPMYKSMGKMFVQDSKQSLLDEINKGTKDSQDLIDALEKKQKFVKRDMEEATSNLRDIIQSAQKSSA